jgi:excisionase family DNA binding protein
MDRLLTAQEVAEMLGVHVNYVYAEAKRGRIPSVPIGRLRRFRIDDIERWLDQNSGLAA